MNLINNGDFAIATQTPPAGGNDATTIGGKLEGGQLDYNVSATGWANGQDGSGNLGYTLIWNNDGTGASYANNATKLSTANGVDHAQLWNLNNGGVSSIPLPSGYTGNILGADGAYEVGALTQTVKNLVVGKTYALTFDYAAAQENGFDGTTTENWKVSLGRDEADTSVINSTTEHSFFGWDSYVHDFTATSTSEVLSFTANGTPGSTQPPFVLLADVQLDEVPEAGTYLAGLFVLLPIGITVMRRLRKPQPVA